MPCNHTKKILHADTLSNVNPCRCTVGCPHMISFTVTRMRLNWTRKKILELLSLNPSWLPTMLHKLDKYAFRDDREKLASSKDHWTDIKSVEVYFDTLCDISGVAVDWNGEINFNDHNKIFLRVFHSEQEGSASERKRFFSLIFAARQICLNRTLVNRTFRALKLKTENIADFSLIFHRLYANSKVHCTEPINNDITFEFSFNPSEDLI